ncbi:MAG: dienelactone hydrolase family protein [Planctomycetota bacterium]|nr:MAG: dienelactone hydrolase family protein [Planctomycetota bacterium]
MGRYLTTQAIDVFWLALVPIISAYGAEAQDVKCESGCLAGTKLLTAEGDLAMEMIGGLDRFLDHKLAASIGRRGEYWQRDYSSPEDYVRSVGSNRRRLARIIGAVDRRCPAIGLELVNTLAKPSLVAGGQGYTVHTVRWPVLDGVDSEGLLLQPVGKPIARVVALPDADWSPEMLVGLAEGIQPAAQFARRLAENGCQVLVPVLIDRSDRWSGNPKIRMTNQPHREFIYRMAFEMGRHIIGYEVQKILAAVDWFYRDMEDKENGRQRVGVVGYGEGGLLALYSAALDQRIDAAVVSGYFESRQEVWREPIYRNVWGLLEQFGDAEIASLVAPRRLIIEAARGVEIEGPPAVREGRSGAAPGRLQSPALTSVRAEFDRGRVFYEKLGVGPKLKLVLSGDGKGAPGSEAALRELLVALGCDKQLKSAGKPPVDLRESFDPGPRLGRQFDQLCEFSQRLVRQSASRRREFWKKADSSSMERWGKSCRYYRDYLRDEVIGRLPPPNVSPKARTRCVLDKPKWTGYEVVLDVWPEVFAYGMLLVPKDLKPGERRPVVVCQHGLEGRPQTIVDPEVESVYRAFGAQLADRGFVVYAPQNPYIGGNKFRQLQRKANPIKCSLFSIIVRQHEQTLNWLSSLPFVDAERIALYGLSYGGKTAMRVPALLPGYCLSICSADFNEWIVKITTLDHRTSYMFTQEYEIVEFDLGNTFNYAELAGLIAPRPFMVERGHSDPVAVDEWVGWEYAKVRRLYVELGIGDRTVIEFFDGGHEIHGVGTFEFLRRHLNWPR